MKLNVIHATANCADTTCPTIYQDEQGRYVIQGFIIKAEDKSSINLPEGEDAVVVPKEFIEAFLAKQK
ncbi:MAG: hypothetical protein AAFY71_24555 [Bacteroidota bacterium]